MSMDATIYLRGMREVDNEFERMIALRDACLAAKVPMHPDVEKYFGDWDQNDYELKLQKFSFNILGAHANGGDIIARVTDLALLEIGTEDSGEATYTYDIHLDKLPTALKILRLEISWG